MVPLALVASWEGGGNPGMNLLFAFLGPRVGVQGREFPARPPFSSAPQTPGSGCLNTSSGLAHRRPAVSWTAL